MSAAPSRCSVPGTYMYVRAAGPGASSHIEATVDALMKTLKGDGRQWNQWNEPMVRAEFRDYLERAEHGKLKPVVEVDALVSGEEAWLYEIRWIDIDVRRVKAGQTEYYGAEVRALHSEPPKQPGHLIGVHVHEKLWWDDDDQRTRDVQNAEIETAVKALKAFAPDNWGLGS
jgi:hypothetical protein